MRDRAGRRLGRLDDRDRRAGRALRWAAGRSARGPTWACFDEAGQHPLSWPRAGLSRDDRGGQPRRRPWRAGPRHRRDGINIAGICCTANEILMRQGMPVAGNYLHQELALLTGAVDLMVVDVQCVMPSLPQVASCHHTKVVTTSPKAHIPGAEHVEFEPPTPARPRARSSGPPIEGVCPPRPGAGEGAAESMDLVAGFTCENLPHYLGGRCRRASGPSSTPWRRAGCAAWSASWAATRCKICQDSHHLGPGAPPAGARRAGACRPDAAPSPRPRRVCSVPKRRSSTPGPGLREVCEAVGMPARAARGQLRGQFAHPVRLRRAGAPRAASGPISPSCRWPRPRPSR